MSETPVEVTPASPTESVSTGLARPSCPMSSTAWGWLVALLGWTTLLSFYCLDGGAGFEPTDCWVSQTAREMQDAGEWLVPQYAGETRMQKSPGPYWAVMLVSTIRGVPVDEVATRIPNGVAAIIITLSIFWLTRRIAGDRAAVFAGFAVASSPLVLYWSHRGASDLGLAAFTTVSLAAFWVAFADTPKGIKRNLLILLGYFAAGLGMLYKMPMPVAVVGAPMFFYVLIRWRWRDLFHPVHLFGVVLFCLPWLPWALAVMQVEPTALAKWKVEFLDRYTGDLPNVEEQKQWRYYFLYLMVPVIYCLPYTLSLPAALWRSVRRDRRLNTDGMGFMLIWFLALLAFFTSSTGKELRYFLPALPPLFVLLGVELAELFDPRRRLSPKLLKLTAISVWLWVPVGFAVGGWVLMDRWYPLVGAKEGFAPHEVLTPFIVTAMIFIVGAAAAAGLFWRGRRNASFATLATTMCAMWLWFWPQMMPVLVSQRPFKDFAAQLETELTAEQQDELRWIGSQDSRVIWHSRVRIPRLIDQLDLLELQGGERSLAREKMIYGETMVDGLRGDERVLYVASLRDYVEFSMAAPPLLADRGETMPPTHIWLMTGVGSLDRYFLVFSNQPPTWPEPQLPEKLAQRVRDTVAAELKQDPDLPLDPNAIDPNVATPLTLPAPPTTQLGAPVKPVESEAE